MKSRWRDDEAAAFVERYGARWGEDLALRTYSSRLIGAEPGLVLHGGGNTSLKGSWRDRLGAEHEALFVKASGHDLATIEPEGHVAVDLAHLRALGALDALDDEAMVDELRGQLFNPRAPTPSIEAPVHALLPDCFVDHSHADAVLALTNQSGGEAQVRAALGEGVVVLPYVVPGFDLAKAVAAAREAAPEARAMVWMRHGLVTWGETARDSYELMIELVSLAETYLAEHERPSAAGRAGTTVEDAEARLARVAPVVRGLLAAPSGDDDRPHRRIVLRSLVDQPVLDLLDAPGARELVVTPPLTADHLIRTKVLPAWVEAPAYDDEARLEDQLRETVRDYAQGYEAYLARYAGRLPAGVAPFDPLPRVVLMPGLGALCAGRDAAAAAIARDIIAQTLAAKGRIAAMGGTYQGLEETHLFDMEYRVQQHAKLTGESPPLAGQVALVTGAAGAIGAGVCERLLEAGGHLALTDLAGPNLDGLGEQLVAAYPGRVIAAPLDVTDRDSVGAGFDAVSRVWGGVDLVVINAGGAHVSTLTEMEEDDFRRLERINTEGALLLLGEAGRHFKRQGTGGDVVLISTKNVFAPGAGFGAYSATKAAAHQLARVASLELAEHDVRVNMVAPDAVFSHGARKSGLWAEVGPERMKARGLDAEGLEEYYRGRNLLHARVTARHVANAVLFFATRQTPTTGATLPVDGGLPDATPR
jgi:rhamnose utilization protein RhaD (predicted bifunctional aldolase and dehydrogenase)/NAD(P)-dependent dehydrogenase (short-subunit alcohol dehydrogenase family)